MPRLVTSQIAMGCFWYPICSCRPCLSEGEIGRECSVEVGVGVGVGSAFEAVFYRGTAAVSVGCGSQ